MGPGLGEGVAQTVRAVRLLWGAGVAVRGALPDGFLFWSLGSALCSVTNNKDA